MRRLLYLMSMTLDGFVARPDQSLDWGRVDAEFHHFINDRQREIEVELYGRRLYETMQVFWPTADQNPDSPDYVIDFAQIWKNRPKLVFSHTLTHVEPPAKLVREDPLQVARELKQGSGGVISVGGATLAAEFVRAGLVDEYEVYLVPVLIGAGMRMFPPLDADINLRLVESHTFKSGVMWLRYLVED